MTSPYLLPDGPVQICFSGGRTSGFLLHQILAANGGLDPDRHAVVFTNTGLEHPATLDFVAECADRWGVRVEWVEYRLDADRVATFETVSHNSAARDGLPFDLVIGKRGFLPNQAARFCTVELKSRTASRYLQAERGWSRWVAALGIRADEPRRLEKTVRRDGAIYAERIRDRQLGWYPLATAGVSRRDVAAFWAAQPFDLRLASHDGKTPAGNCIGCFLKSEATVAAMWRDHPDAMEWWRGHEARSGKQFSKRYSHDDMARMVRAQGDWLFNSPDYLCQADGGECTG